MRVSFDAKILFSAAQSDGAVRALCRLLRQHGHECWADADVVAEARRNLHAKGPQALAAFDVLLVDVQIAAAGAPVRQAQTEDLVAWLPEKNRPALAAAIALGCDALVTGDRTHFGQGYGRSFGGVTVYSPAMLAERLFGSG